MQDLYQFVAWRRHFFTIHHALDHFKQNTPPFTGLHTFFPGPPIVGGTQFHACGGGAVEAIPALQGEEVPWWSA